MLAAGPVDLLIDTCTALWYWSGDARLGADAEAAFRDPTNEIWFHQVSYLEITLKYTRGKLTLTEPPSALVPDALSKYRMRFAPLSNRDVAGLETLPFHHRDPFDRLLIARALRRGWTIVSPDEAFALYGVRVLW